MISKRAPRSVNATESLRQQVLNFQQGIDGTRPITDTQTAYATENLNRNPDGTLSIRKPIIAVDNSEIYKQESDKTARNTLYLYDNITRVVVDSYGGSLALIDSEKKTVSISVRWTTIDGVRRTAVWDTQKLSIPDKIEIINTATSSILCGVSINPLASPFGIESETSGKSKSNLVDTNLYDEHDASEETQSNWYLPRYLKLFYSEDDGTWYADIISPEVNTVTISEGDAPLKANLTLDNTYATRDQYMSLAPTVKSIVPYMFSGLIDNKPVPVSPTETETHIKLLDMTIQELTESCRARAYRPVHTISRTQQDFSKNIIVLKAFCNFPKYMVRSKTEDDKNGIIVCCRWERSLNGIEWENVKCNGAQVTVWEPEEKYNPQNVTNNQTDIKYIENEYYYNPEYEHSQSVPLSETDLISLRQDVLNVSEIEPIAPCLQYAYRFKMIGVRPITETDNEYDSTNRNSGYIKTLTYGQSEYSFVFDTETSLVYNDLGNSVNGEHLYYNKTLYSYGNGLQHNNIFVSDVGSFVTPLTNTIDLDASQDTVVTTLIPWRDYLIATTNSSIYLIRKTDSGFITKTINTSIGIPKQDAKCCKTVINGIIFKSGTKVYMLYPNVYSGDDSTLNLTDISLPIETYLSDYANETGADVGDYPFAFSTESEYVLMIPRNTLNEKAETLCLRYEYSTKIWTVDTYPIVAHGYKIFSINDIRLFGYTKFKSYFTEYYFDKTYKELFPNFDFEYIPYGDILKSYSASGNGLTGLQLALTRWNTETDPDPVEITPIPFMLDTGQKSDTISFTKQFVETKIMLGNLSEYTNYPMKITIAVDGDPHIIEKDLNTDQPNWTKNINDVGIANTNIFLSATDSDAKNVLRQAIFRYSVRGKSIRHIIKGTSLYNFCIHEMLIRFKILNVKQ